MALRPDGSVRRLTAGATPEANVVIEALTAREREVLVAMLDGSTYKEIARKLGVAVQTIKNHQLTIREKLGCRNRTEAMMLALQRGLMGMPVVPARWGPAPAGGRLTDGANDD